MPNLAPSPENVLLGKGKLLFDRFSTAGAAQGYFHLGNCETFEVNTEDDVLENQNSMIAAGGVYKSVTRARTVTLSISGFEFATDSLAIALMAEVTSFTQTTGTATSTLTTNVVKGKFYRTPDRDITVTSLTSVTGTTTSTLTAGTDYSVFDSQAAVIQILATAPNVTNGGNLVIIYTRAALTGTAAIEALSGAKASKIEGTLLFLPDPATGPDWEIICWIVSFNPDGATGFISEDFGTWSVTGRVSDDSAGAHGGSASFPYYRALQRANV